MIRMKNRRPQKLPPCPVDGFIDLRSSGECDCVTIDKCQWSEKAFSSVLGLPRNDPKIKTQVEFIKKYICDAKNKLIYCCGSAQSPPSNKKNQPGEFVNCHSY